MYDAIIVGARCAGAPTAMLLARKGYRILLVDKATFPSDTISTHIIWPHGAEIIDRWGLFLIRGQRITEWTASGPAIVERCGQCLRIDERVADPLR
jgi:flavin-dependent dehydrogenase